MLEKFCKYLSFGSIAVLILYMAAMTVLEKFSGTAAAMRWGYHSAFFIALWALALVSGVVYYVRRTSCRPAATAGIHASFVLILSGAMITHVCGEQGAVHLRLGDAPVSEYLTEDLQTAAFPFTLSLEDFEIEYYPGTYAPTDYVSTLAVNDGSSEQTLTVSMNRIGSWRGYRFYQSSYDEDAGGSTLAVSRDPAGVAVTYIGYALLLLSLAGFFFQRNSRFRAVLRRVSKMVPAAALLLVLGGFAMPEAEAKEAMPEVLPKETAEAYGRMYVYYNDRVCPVQTLARDFTMKLYGKPSYRGLTSEQVLTGWIFHYDSWSETLEQGGSSKKALKEFDEKRQLVMLVCGATLLKIFPYADAEGSVAWYASTDRLPAEMDSDQWLFVRKVMSLAGESIVKNDFQAAGGIFDKIAEYQKKTAAGSLPSDSRIAAERLYNAVEHPKAAAIACLAFGLLLFVLNCFSSGLGRTLKISVSVLAVLVLLYLSFVLGLRWHISGHAPFSNGFEVMMLVSWLTMLLGLLVRRRFAMMQPLVFLLGGFALLVASIGESDPAIAYLTPVLSSPLLSLHVMTMMISYTLLGLVMLNGVMALVKYGRSEAGLAQAADVSLLFLYPAVFFLAAGTFLGAVWANVSWGRYWAWDPKEVWALITLLVYAFALHSGSLKKFSDPRFFHWFCIFAFICVLVTYFGVNFFLGGLHSYA